MDRKEIAKRMAESVIDIDKELAAKTHRDIQGYLTSMRQDSGLKARYESLSISASRAFIKFKGRKLEFSLRDKEIAVNLTTEDGNSEEFDIIKSVNGKLVCNDGEFELSELDRFMNRAFGDLLN